ncbi:MAG TPA: AAA family ATPase [Nannocystaceae bacterium]|nr:AAA family ATPase [Nannocystaceae bacterium]
MRLPYPCPDPARSLAIDWASLDAPWIAELAACPQDPEHHAEGDVWTHTKMVCEALVHLPEWQALPEGERELVFAAALLHDIAKPACTRIEDGRIRQPGHSLRGAAMLRAMLWRAGAPPRVREAIAGLVRHHQVPFFLIDHADPRRRLAALSQVARCDHLALLTRADALGRITRDPQRLLDNIDLFTALAEGEGCDRAPFAFPSDHTRFLYFRDEGRDPHTLAFDDTRCEVVVMSGLPGSGKDRWIRDNLDLPVISLDGIRDELDMPATGEQGAVINAARDRAREHLRRGEPFVWNATCLGRDIRRRIIDLCAAYRARVRLVYIEVPRARLLQQNRARAAVVPEAAIERMTRLWEPPDATEAHRVDWILAQ